MAWLTRRQAHSLRAQQGIPISEYGREAVEALIQELPKFMLKAGFLRPVRTGSTSDSDTALETAENGGQPVENQNQNQNHNLQTSTEPER
ncbi:hypothetical protein Ccrd_022856 [Cynara cardunculus var. scolymus]|uniref:Uncharacterized protein n=1 Tax=Cynara cardunculus var. scolymus TaxID=59895 RepID=A0A103XXW1_CYNCS|nr:hypothetical protein Ccrd_022856 [Cynara cardunculus var. scolymus]